MTAEIIDKLQEKATVLTQERKKRGKTVPEVSSPLILVCIKFQILAPVLFRIHSVTYVTKTELTL
jgi:hypothetical protein